MARGNRGGNRRAKRGGGGWLVLLLLIGGVAAAVIFAPGFFMGLLPTKEPANLGDEPTETQDTTGETAAKDQDDLATTDFTVDNQQLAPPKEIVKPNEDDAPEGPIIGADEARANELLAKAEAAYFSFDWDAARSTAGKVTSLRASAKVRARAREIISGSDTFEELFSTLDIKDELVRNIETHPQLVTITSRGEDLGVIPLMDMNDKEIPKTNDPAGWVQNQLASKGEVVVQLTSGVATIYKSSQISEVRAADRDAVMMDKQRELAKRVDRLKGSQLASDALAWYDAGKFAYQNRLDDKVIPMLDQAVKLNPFLGTAVKEDLAQFAYFNMVKSLDNQNRASAAGWKRQIEKYFTDTTIYDQAVAYYANDLGNLRAAREQALAKRREQKERAREERLRRAREAEDEAAMRAIQAESANDIYDGPGEEVVAAAGGDKGKADTFFNKGCEIMAQAQALGVSDERDQLYAKAEKEFNQAVALYGKLGLEQEMVQANQYRYACIKYRRF